MSEILLRKQRDAVIRYLYEHGAARPHFAVDGSELMQKLGLSKTELDRVGMVMLNQGLLAPNGPVNSLTLSPAGQDEAERLGVNVSMREPVNVQPIVIHANSGIIQIGGAGSAQNASISVTDFTEALESLQAAINASPGISEKERAEGAGLIDALRDGVKTLPSAAVQAIVKSLVEIAARHSLALPAAIAGLIAG